MKYFLFLTFPLFFLDWITKEWAVGRFPPPEENYSGERIEVIPGFFELHRIHNTGIFFGHFNGTIWANVFFSIVCALALASIFFFWRRGAFPTKTTKVAVALLTSGILGNLLDRLMRGYVVDFLGFDLGFMRWPSFNVADACICIAAVLLFLSAFQEEAQPKKAAATPDPDPEA